MKVLAPTVGLIETDRTYSSYLNSNAFIIKDSKRIYYFMMEVLNELKLYNSFLNQDWINYEGEIYDSFTMEAIDFNKKNIFQKHVRVDEKILPCEELRFAGELRLEKDTEYLYYIKAGKYSVYQYAPITAYGYEYIVLEGLNNNFPPIFKVIEIQGFYTFELERNLFVCWKIGDQIDSSFFTTDPHQDLAAAYRKHLIGRLTND